MENVRQKAYNLLRWSERYTKTDMVYLARGGFWLTSIQIFGAITALILSIAFANLLSKYEFGVYKYVLSVAGIIGALSLTGLGTAVTQAVARGLDHSLRYGFWINLRWSGAVVATSIIGSIYYFLNENVTLSISLLIIALTTPFIHSASLFGSYLSGKKDFKSLGIYNFWRNTITTGLLITCIFLTKNPLTIIAVYFLSNLVINLVFYLITVKKYSLEKKENSEMTSYAKHLSLMSVLNIVAENIDKVIIFQFIGAVELAVYTFATAIPTQIKGVLKNIYQLAFPKFTLRNTAELKKELPKKMLIVSFVTLLIFIFYYFSAPIIFKYIFPQYLEAVKYSQLFMFSIIFYSSILVGTALQSKKMISEMYRASIISSPIKIILVIILTYTMGILGLIIARILSELLNLVILSIFFFKKKSEC